MRIAIISDAWHPQINGVIRTIEQTVRALEALGHSVCVIGPDQFRSVPCPFYPDIRLALWPYKKLSQLLTAFAPEAVHLATEGPLGWAARCWCVRHDLPFTTAYHTRFPQYLKSYIGLPERFGYALLRRFHAAAHAVLVPTQTMYDDLARHGFSKMRFWSRGVDLAQFTLGDATTFQDLPRPVLLYVGRVSREKNIDAFLELNVTGSKVVVGGGPELQGLKTRYPDVLFTGPKEGADLAAHFRSADVFVFPSQTDTFGLVLIEALASGLKVAAYPVAGPLDVILPRDVAAGVAVLDDDLGKAVEGCLASPATKEACRQTAERYSWQAATEQFLDGFSAAP